MPHALVGVFGTGDEATVGDKVLVGAKALDAVGLEVDGEGSDFAHAGDPHQSLNVVVRDEDRLQKAFQFENLLIEERDLLIEIVEMEPVSFREMLRHRALPNDQEIVAVEFAADVVDADTAGGAFLHEAKACTHHVAQRSELRSDFVCAGNTVQAKERGEGLGIDLVGLDLGVGDGFQVFCMSEDEFDAVGRKDIVEPVPARSAFDDRDVRTRRRCEVAEDEIGNVRDALLLHDRSGVIDGGDEAVVFVQVET